MARTNKIKKEICLEIVEENGGSLSEVQDIVESQFKFLCETMGEGRLLSSTYAIPRQVLCKT